jgi:hypothetical protein
METTGSEAQPPYPLRRASHLRSVIEAGSLTVRGDRSGLSHGLRFEATLPGLLVAVLNRISDH